MSERLKELAYPRQTVCAVQESHFCGARATFDAGYKRIALSSYDSTTKTVDPHRQTHDGKGWRRGDNSETYYLKHRTRD